MQVELEAAVPLRAAEPEVERVVRARMRPALLVRRRPRPGRLDPDRRRQRTARPASLHRRPKQQEGSVRPRKRRPVQPVLHPAGRARGDTDPLVYQEAMKYCTERRAMLIVDPPAEWGIIPPSHDPIGNLTGLNFSADDMRNAAIYFPRVRLPIR